MGTLKPFLIGGLLAPLFLAAAVAKADHIPENLFEEVYREIMTPICLDLQATEDPTKDCETLDPVVFQCWKEKLHMRYDEAGILALLEEAKASNQKYKYFYEPYYNEFFSNRNWDNLMDFTDRC